MPAGVVYECGVQVYGEGQHGGTADLSFQSQSEKVEGENSH
jgi:hypothetical protein